MFIRNLFPLFDVNDSPGLGGLSDVDALEKGIGGKTEEVEEKEEKKEEKKEEEVEEEPKDKLEDIEEEIEEEEEEEKEEEENKEEEEEEEEDPSEALQISVKNLKKDFPEIFNKYPDLKDAIFRDREYGRIFGDPEEAKEALDKAQMLDELAQEVMSGNPAPVISTVSKSGGKEALENFATKFLPTIYQADKELFFRITDELLAKALNSALDHSSKSGNKNLGLAAKHLSLFFFNDQNIPDFKEKKVEKTPEQIAFEQERVEFQRNKFKEAESGIHRTTRGLLVREILKGLDPNNTMDDFTRDAVVDKIIEEVGGVLETDVQLRTKLRSLWKSAAEAGFSKEAKSKIISAYFARARRVIPAVRRKVRSVSDSSSKTNEKLPKKPVPNAGGGSDNKPIVPFDIKSRRELLSKYSDEEILAGKR